ncbi:MAG TPA: FmdE family protein [Methanoregulaceae archaeon]|nr:FmdE family protein [Methanoregulaceae archaeon]
MKAGTTPLDLMNARMEAAHIRPDLQESLRQCVAIHTSPAPGLLIGAFMADFALELLGADPAKQKIFSVCETPKCAPDALQVIARSTTGNGRLKMIPVGPSAAALTVMADGPTAEAVRVFIDMKKLRNFPVIESWYANSPSYDKKTMDESLQQQIFRAGRDILSYEWVRVNIFGRSKWKPVTCSVCGEPVPDYLAEGDRCGACGSMKYCEKI